MRYEVPYLSETRRFSLLIIVLIGTLLGPLDSAVNIAFPDITSSFGLELKAIRWVVIAYLATYASLMLVFGRVGDLIGHNRVFIAGLVVCILGFGICSIATSYNWLLVFRVLQGIGTALVLSCGPALATSLYSERWRPRVLGAYAMMFGLGGALGPSLGGWLVEHWGWQAVFWFRLPIALIALLLSLVLRMPMPERDHGSFDLGGAVLLAMTTALLLATITQLDRASENLTLVTLLFAFTVSAVAFFIVRSVRSSNPIIDLRTFSEFSFTWMNIATIAVNLAGFATMLFVPYFLVRVSELTLSESGLIMAVGPVGMMIASKSAGHVLPHVGAQRLAIVAGFLVASGLLWMSYWGASTGSIILCAALLLHGIGLGLFQVAALDFIASALPVSQRGVAGSLALVMRTIGVVISASVLTIAFAHFQTVFAPGGADGFVSAFQQVFWYAAVGLAGFVAASLLRMVRWRRRNS
ncbi:MAG: MFS transporter [Hyphomicrobiaceae bacterium TMED74]|nr:hypothetical protein [Filomicrobium sp.]RPG48558.1 MAG: MFS transporter [Hyphomicrobiaceae bacterium TMED74]